MTKEEERLIELIAQGNIMAFGKSESFAEIIADHLLANGVTIPVRCKDCKYFDEEDKLADVFGKEPPHFYCTLENLYVPICHFCSCGERKEK